MASCEQDCAGLTLQAMRDAAATNDSRHRVDKQSVTTRPSGPVPGICAIAAVLGDAEHTQRVVSVHDHAVHS